MSIYFKGEPGNGKNSTKPDLPFPNRFKINDSTGYIAGPGLTDAVDVAIVLGQPLLLTGEPGTGKTLLAYAVGNEFDLKIYKFETKSTSTARDLFYLYDTIGRFQAKQIDDKEWRNPVNYITYNALGKAILQTKKKEEIIKWLPQASKEEMEDEASECIHQTENGEKKEEEVSEQFTRDYQHTIDWQSRSIVLIDEVDKAPRDFPNDILNEIEGMYFKIPELGNKSFKTDAKMRPIVIITSNSEKHLPDAFLRRCVFYNIDFPEKDDENKTMKRIIERRVGKHVVDCKEFLNDAISLFYELRESRTGLQKKPATAELLGWIIALKEMNKDQKNPINKNNEKKILNSLSVLIKNKDDITQAQKAVKQWLKRN